MEIHSKYKKNTDSDMRNSKRSVILTIEESTIEQENHVGKTLRKYGRYGKQQIM